MIEAESLVKTYVLGGDTIRALDGVSLHVDKGEMVAVTGASGSGKSTLLHILGCLDSPDSGSYHLADEDVSKLDKNTLAEVRNRRLGFVFQTFNLLPRMSALENVRLPLLYAGGTFDKLSAAVLSESKGGGRGAKERAGEALRTVGLGDRMKHDPTQLSGGERQRVAIARAIVADPAVIFADEPTGNLDSSTGNEIMSIFEMLNSAGRTIVVVTHDAEVAAHCRRRVHMRDGRIVDEQG